MRRGHASTFRNQLLITDSKDIPPRRPCDAFFRIFKSCSDQTVQDGFLFVNFGPTCYAQPNYGSAYHPLPYYAQPVGYYRPAYHWACLYERGWSGYYDPNYC